MSESRRCSPSFTRLRISSSVTRGAVTTYSGKAPEARRIVSSTASTGRGVGAASARAPARPTTSASAARSGRRERGGISEQAELEVLLWIVLDVEEERVQARQAPGQLVVELGVAEHAPGRPLPGGRQAG